ncbi:hypothetical protein H310_13714 [Aphanomyces invadans]|uniref:Uncharacterized protein n=1 Tax=Aphanomyces invadans TaxID=157072 RepID=A0A024TF40_9STRA|nr:hypothetical protein H310_13714 [Aphanomyces invadans]ETV91927.1 hypothetical protein H310_13714 [Aphanomyces invadans]|eukprot:XP_008879564.1 hypothetical protein H310_13714 [Aphanomyces invadans]
MVLLDPSGDIPLASFHLSGNSVRIRRAVPTCATHGDMLSSPLIDVLTAERDNDAAAPTTVFHQLGLPGLVFGLTDIRANSMSLERHQFVITAVDNTDFTFFLGSGTAITRRQGAPSTYSFVVHPGHDVVLIVSMSIALALLG